MAARLARSNVEASIERYRAEPGASQEELERVMSMLASSHRFAHALMTIARGGTGSQSVAVHSAGILRVLRCGRPNSGIIGSDSARV